MAMTTDRPIDPAGRGSIRRSRYATRNTADARPRRHPEPVPCRTVHTGFDRERGAAALPGPEVRLLRLLQLSSPTLPVGAFSYSQGLEYAVDCGWVSGLESFRQWLTAGAGESLACLELPVLLRLHDAVRRGNNAALRHWVDLLVASRETREMRTEESARGRAMVQVLVALEVTIPDELREVLGASQLAGVAFAGAHWDLPAGNLAAAHAWSWLENQVTAGIKLIPLGQSDGQRLLFELGEVLVELVERARIVGDDEIGAACPALAIASSLHETQYTRLFRS